MTSLVTMIWVPACGPNLSLPQNPDLEFFDMPRPRLTQHQAAVTGADRKDPQRFKNRATPTTQPLGEPPERLSEPVRAAWLDLAADLPWLARSDRKMLELTAQLSVMAQAPDAPVSVFAQMRLCLSSLAATPVDRSKIAVADDDDKDPLAEFLN